jgi:transposase
MVKVDEYARIRRAHVVEKLSVRELARQFHHSRRKIREILGHAEPRPYTRTQTPPSVLDPFKSIIGDILRTDADAPRKQRHTAARVFRRLRDEHGYGGSAERVRLYIRSQRPRTSETFIPLDHDPGQRLEADFGHIYVDFPKGRQLVPILLVTWGYSNCPFALALPTERTEAILHGLVEAFTFFGCVPHELWWDNPRTVAPHIFVGRDRQLNDRYQALASHYLFEPLFCLVRRPQEKPRVESRVQFLQQDWATPVPKVHDLAELNAHLRTCALRDRDRTQAGQTETIGQRFTRECDNALSLPAFVFDPCICQPAKVDKYQTVRFDSNRYSVPRSAAFQTVTVKGYVDHIEIVADGQVLAQHPRSYGQHEQCLDPQHYLETLDRKPAALDHANVFRRWQLPPLFAELRADLERQHGPRRGVKHYIRVVRLLAEQSPEQVQRAIEKSRTELGYDVEAILQRVRRQTNPVAEPPPLDLSEQPAAVRDVHVPLPDLRKFNQFLSSGEKNDDRSQYPAVESQPEATAAADDARRVCGPGPRGGHGQRELRAVPAAPDGTGGGSARRQRLEGPHQASRLSGAQGFRHLRLRGAAVTVEAEAAGASARRVDRSTLQHMSHRQCRDRQDALGRGLGLGRLSARPRDW